MEQKRQRQHLQELHYGYAFVPFLQILIHKKKNGYICEKEILKYTQKGDTTQGTARQSKQKWRVLKTFLFEP